jgi:NADH-quinone oxidoreductase subunit M
MGLLLVATLVVPVLGAILNDGNGRRMRWMALGTTLVTLLLASVLIYRFPGGAEEFAVFDAAWLAGIDSPAAIRFSIGLDGLSLWLFGLTALLMVVAVLISWEAVTQRAAAYYSLLLLLETGMLGVFVARDVILFYVFFEFTLIPLFFLIGIWGSDKRRYAATKFFLFTFAGSVLTFLGLLAIVLWDYYQNGILTFSIPELTLNLGYQPIDPPLQVLIFLLLFAGFAVKVPLFPFHTWLPLAHVEAPTAGSVLLAGVLLKVGSYGFVRFALPMLPEAVTALMPFLLWLCVAGILYGALVALVQDDIKRLIAYSSVSHLGFVMLGVFALNRLGMQGGVLQMINHGLSTGGLFALVGMLYERYHTRKIADYGGMTRRLPVLAFFMVLFTLSSIGLPGLNGFAGEFLLLLGMFQRGWAEAPEAWQLQLKVIAVLATLGVVLGAWYMLSLVQRVFFGPLREPPSPHAHGGEPVRDLSLREVAALVPLAVFVVWIGLWPQFFLDRMAPTLNQITARTAQPLERRLVGNDGSIAEQSETVARIGLPRPDSEAPLPSLSTPHSPLSTH